MKYSAKTTLCLFVLSTIAIATPLWAQPTVRFPTTNTTAYQMGAAPQPGSTIAPPAPASPPAGVGATFDPYSASPGAAAYQPTLAPSAAPYGTPPSTMQPYPGSNPYPNAAGSLGAPAAAPYGAPAGQPYGAAPYGAGPGTTPSAMYPNGWNTSNWALPSTQFLTPRARYTYVDGGSSVDSLGINDFDVSVAASFPNFLYSNQPLYVVPSFSLHLWQGPQSPRDLPANAYSAFLDFGWSTAPEKPLGGELGVRLGVFTDFNTFNTNSGRIMGRGLVRLRTTPEMTLRGGVVYINRNDLKLLPAFGLLWTPNSKTRFDIYFPRPKLAQQLTTMGNHDVWWYLGAEYGGGAWTVQRESGSSDRIDINDIRVILGIEWGQSALLQQGRRTGFFEVGWVTERKVVYVATPELTGSMKDSFMLRVGWNY